MREAKGPLYAVYGLVCLLVFLFFLARSLAAAFGLCGSEALTAGVAAAACLVGAFACFDLDLRQIQSGRSKRRRAVEARRRGVVKGRLGLSVRAQEAARRCAYCHEDFSAAEAAHPCPGCRTRAHAECWAEAGSCPTLGCVDQPRASPIFEAMARRADCSSGEKS